MIEKTETNKFLSYEYDPTRSEKKLTDYSSQEKMFQIHNRIYNYTYIFQVQF